jgi:hypothetical protein
LTVICPAVDVVVGNRILPAVMVKLPAETVRPEGVVTVPPVAVSTMFPLPEFIFVVEVVFDDPNVTVFAPTPVPRFTILAVALVPIAIVPVPEFMVIGPLPVTVVNDKPVEPA